MDLFLCDHFACRLTAAACVARQERTTQGGHALTDTAECRRCEQGRQVRAGLERTGALAGVQAQTEALERRRRGDAIRRPRRAAGKAPASTQPATVEAAPTARQEPQMKPQPAPEATVSEPIPAATPREPVATEPPPAAPIHWSVCDLSDEQLAALAEVVGAEAERRAEVAAA